MNSITFIDIEADPVRRRIFDMGAIRQDGSFFHDSSLKGFARFLKESSFICGHNIFDHDLKYIRKVLDMASIIPENKIDTLYLSPLLFPAKPYHALVKDDKLQTDGKNNPLNDSKKAKDLFFDEIYVFQMLDDPLKEIFYSLLHKVKEFEGFFRYLHFENPIGNPVEKIQNYFEGEICKNAEMTGWVSENPVALAYCLALIHSFIKHHEIHSITPPWALLRFPEVESIMSRLRNSPCLPGCSYCDKALDFHKGLKRFFGFDAFRTYGGAALQEKAVKAAVDNKSLLAVFPTGGGKSVTFQVPALMSGDNTGGLTVVISPLQSLMKDQVDNLEKIGITEAVTINGLLDPIDRAQSFERVEEGSASILYISPESLRSKSIEKALLGRKIIRFVIDEAHCLSSWGQEFRVDYLYIGDFIRRLQERKNLTGPIPVSCFTATAKPGVVEDIKNYFREKLSLELKIFSAKVSRENLRYKVFEKKETEEKYQTLRDLLEAKKCPTIIYVSRTRRAFDLAARLREDGFNAKPFHGKMPVKEKTDNQNAFIAGEVQIIVATSAFGMGVDKKDVGLVLHYEISDSLENYIQEAGRAGRDQNTEADCYVLFNEEDLSKHFILLNEKKLSIGEIQQVWKAIKEITRFRSKVSNSALEIARKAGWDDHVIDIETRVKTAIAALEDAGYLKRGQNMPRIFASGILSKNAQEAIEKIKVSKKFNEKQKAGATRIIKKLFSSKSRKQTEEEIPESRVDYISDHLGMVKEQVIEIINLLREENILADTKDLTAFIKKNEHKNQSLNLLKSYSKIERFLLSVIMEEEKIFSLKELNENAEKYGCEDVNIRKIKTIINFWVIKNWIKRRRLPDSRRNVAIISLFPKKILMEKMEKRHELSQFLVEYLFSKSNLNLLDVRIENMEVLVEFSVHELKDAFEKQDKLFNMEAAIPDIEDALFYLSRLESIKIEGGFLVIYNRLTLERLEQDNRKRYTNEDYKKLKQFYDGRVQQIHIVGEYARKMIMDYKEALLFVEDYFALNYSSFLKKYFPGSKADALRLKMTPTKFKQLFGALSPAQLKIIKDNHTKYIVVAAGPGSGKTRLLVHKLASLLLMEDVKQEQLLMVTFSRAAATEFKKRLLQLIGNAANNVDIKTFHSYCFDLLGQIGSLEKSDDIIRRAIRKIKNNEVEPSLITKTVIVIDEAQDMDEDEYQLIKTLMKQNENMRVIAVGDDDQNIYHFRGASSKYMRQIMEAKNSQKYELVENYRSKRNLVDFTNQFVTGIWYRLKSTPIMADDKTIGKIKIVHYKTDHLITPLIKDLIKTDLKGSVGVLTKTNEEALQVTSLLLKEGLSARLVQYNEGFSLYNLEEVRYFLNRPGLKDTFYIIPDDSWESAKEDLTREFKNSFNRTVCEHLINDFESIHPKRKYKSDFEVFIRESALEDFQKGNRETIFVSTIHKSKGKEFDNVFLMLNQFNAENDEGKRQLYVAMTRARNLLSIHLNSHFLDYFQAEGLVREEDACFYGPLNELTLQLHHKDVWLGFFADKQSLIAPLRSGEPLIVKETGCQNRKGLTVLLFSRQFLKRMEKVKKSGFEPKTAKVNFVLYWQPENNKEEIKIILPEIQFVKKAEDYPF